MTEGNTPGGGGGPARAAGLSDAEHLEVALLTAHCNDTMQVAEGLVVESEGGR